MSQDVRQAFPSQTMRPGARSARRAGARWPAAAVLSAACLLTGVPAAHAEGEVPSPAPTPAEVTIWTGDHTASSVSGTHNGTWQGQELYVAGDTPAPNDEAFAFPGSVNGGSRVVMDQAVATFGTAQARITFKMRTTATGQYSLMSARSSCNNVSEGWFDVRGGRTIGVEFGGSTYAAVGSTRVVNDGEWHRVDIRRDDAGITLTVDGESSFVPVAPADINPIVPFGLNNSPCIGSTDGTGSFQGAIDDVRIVKGKDVTAPVVSVPRNATAEATGPAGATVGFDAATATDDVDGDLGATCDRASGTSFAMGATTVTCTATDSSGNVGRGSFTVTVEDTTAPAVTVPRDLVLEATGPDGAVATFDGATASDIVDGAVTATCDRASGSTFALGTTTVTCTAADAAGNTGEAQFTVTVRDTTGPVVTAEDVTVEATGPKGATVDFTAKAIDIVDGEVTPVVCTPPAGSTFEVGATSVTCTASDERRNPGEGTFTVTVTDTRGPVLLVPENMTVEATGPDGATVEFVATADDVVDGAVAPECKLASGDLASGSTFALGKTEVTCTAKDARDNVSTASFTVEVVDRTGPKLTLPGDMTVEATGPEGATVDFVATAVDVVDGAVAPECKLASGDLASGSTFALGTTEVTCTAQDARGNESTGSFDVEVVDTAPVLHVPDGLTIEASGAGGAKVSFDATATDLVDGDVAVTCDHLSGETFRVGDTKVTCSATDSSDNVGTGTFTVTVTPATAGPSPLVEIWKLRLAVTAQGPGRSFVHQVRSAAAAIAAGDDASARRILRSFQSHVRAQTGKSVTAARAAAWIAQAQRISALLED